jgi:hypothetical protein
MADTKPYIPHSPGDLITAEDWNDMQVGVRKDIAAQIATSIAAVKDVDHASNSDKIGGQSVADLTKSILDQVFALLPKRTGYMQVFCNLALQNDRIIHHNLKAFPVADVYQLDYFEVVCAKGENASDNVAEWVQFYLYHADEPRLRIPPSTVPIEIETKPRYRILWKTLIDQLVDQKLLTYTDDTTLDDLETDFWRALFRDPNDEFDPDAYCHSPWFEKCCGEQRSVSDLTKHGDFDDIYLKVMPRKTINFPIDRPIVSPGIPANPAVSFGGPATGVDSDAAPEPTNIRVSHLDFDSVALRLLKPPVFPLSLSAGATSSNIGNAASASATAPQPLPLPQTYTNRLAVMVLLKV